MTQRLRTALAEISTAANALLESTADYEKLLGTIARTAAKTLHAACSVTLFDDSGTTMTPVAVYDEDPAVAAKLGPLLSHPRPVDMPLVEQTRSAGIVFRPEIVLDEVAPSLTREGAALFRDLRVRGFIVVTMRSSRGPIGTITAMRHRADLPALDDLDREVAQYLGGFAGLALENARLFRSAQSADELRRSEGRAHQATMFLDAIIENIPDMVFVKDAERLSFVRFNRAGEQLLGLPARGSCSARTTTTSSPRTRPSSSSRRIARRCANKQLVDIPEEPIQTATRPALAAHEEGADRRRQRRAAVPARDLGGHHRPQARRSPRCVRPRTRPRRRTGSSRRSATRSRTTCARRCARSTGSARRCSRTIARQPRRGRSRRYLDRVRERSAAHGRR